MKKKNKFFWLFKLCYDGVSVSKNENLTWSHVKYNMGNGGGKASLSGLGDTGKISSLLNWTLNTHGNVEKKHMSGNW